MRRLVPFAVAAALVAVPAVPALAGGGGGPGTGCHLVWGEGPSPGEGLPGLPSPYMECW